MLSQEIKQKIGNLKHRTVFDKLIKFLDLPDIEILLGMRQVGKTSLLYLLIDYLLKTGVPESNIFFFSLNDIALLEAFNKNHKELELFLQKQQIDKNHRVYIFIDEIQYMDNPTMFLKYYADKFSNYKFFATGSSSFEIKNKIKESLAGRKKIIQINPLSFKEFLEFKNSNSISIKAVSDILNVQNLDIGYIEQEDLKTKFEEFLIFGGHPKAALLDKADLKIAELNDIYSSYVQKDIKDLANIENISGYNSVIQILASQIGNLLNFSELSSTLDLDMVTLKKYVFLLNNTFVSYLLKPYSRNKRTEISKMPKTFMEDLGIRNAIVKDFRSLELRGDSGAMAENFVFNEIMKSQSEQEDLFFWRTLSKSETDFVYKKENEVIPIEVKYKKFNSPDIPSGVKNFIRKYKPKKALVITKDYFNRIDFNETEIIFFPIYLI